jgi:hypothetical protein
MQIELLELLNSIRYPLIEVAKWHIRDNNIKNEAYKIIINLI